MLVDRFNEKYDGQLKLIHRHDYRNGFHFLAQWCPIAQKYERMNTYHLNIHKCHFDGFEVPPKFLKSVEEFELNGFRRNLILVATEKHGTHYYDGSTVESLGCACLTLLNSRLKQGWYAIYDEPKSPEYEIEDVKKSPEISKIIKSQWEFYYSQMKYRERTLSLVEHITKYTENREYFQAFNMLESRNDHQYERIEIELLEVVQTNFD